MLNYILLKILMQKNEDHKIFHFHITLPEALYTYEHQCHKYIPRKIPYRSFFMYNAANKCALRKIHVRVFAFIYDNQSCVSPFVAELGSR